jgi:hypothetical protein
MRSFICRVGAMIDTCDSNNRWSVAALADFATKPSTQTNWSSVMCLVLELAYCKPMSNHMSQYAVL